MNCTYTTTSHNDSNLTADKLIQAYKELQSKYPPVPDTIRCHASMIDRLRTTFGSAVAPDDVPVPLLGVRIEVMDALPDGVMLSGRYVKDGDRTVFKPAQVFTRTEDGKWAVRDWDVLMAMFG